MAGCGLHQRDARGYLVKARLDFHELFIYPIGSDGSTMRTRSFGIGRKAERLDRNHNAPETQLSICPEPKVMDRS